MAMDPQARNMILLLAGTAALPIIISHFTEDQATSDLAYGLTNLGLVGTIIGIGLGVVIVPRSPVWASALILTLTGLGLKFIMLPHGEHEHEHAHEELAEGVRHEEVVLAV